jgi:deoxyribonuclease-4
VAPRLGIHTFISGSLEKAALHAAHLGANTFQIFSASPRMWRAKACDPVQIKLLRAARERFDLWPLAIHVNYLVNLASADAGIRQKSIACFHDELERAAALGAEYLVVHPGSYRGQSIEAALEAFALGLRDAVRPLTGSAAARRVAILVENTAGAGAHLGSSFEELRTLRGLARDLADISVGYCLDTCHLFAAGYDIAQAAGLSATLRSAEELLGLANVQLIHANDSRAALGARVDRHANIGEGCIGLEGFRRILHSRLRSKPFILETPLKQPEDDRRNLDTLKSLAARRRTTARHL